MSKLIDAAINGRGKYEGKAYFFKGKQYVRYDWDKDDVDDDYPESISAWGFPAPFDAGIDAAVEGRRKFAGKAYFFKKDHYIRFNWAADEVDEDPTPLSDWGLPLLFSKGIDAALDGGPGYEDYSYFFKGDQYVVYNWATDTVSFVKDASNRIKKLRDGWGVPAEFAVGIDAALNGQGRFSGKAYFFRGDQYARYGWASKVCDPSEHIRLWKLPHEFLYGHPPKRFAWIEYQHPGDGVMFATGLAAQGWKNVFDELPEGPGRGRLVEKAGGGVLRAKVVPTSWGGARALICFPTDDDSADFFGRWILNPGVQAGELTNGKAYAQADWVCVSGHGASGEVWGDGSGGYVSFPVAEKAAANVAVTTTGRVKYLIIASCYNDSVSNAVRWEPILRKQNPIHGILGYERSYSGNALGAKVMQAFTALLKVPKKTIIEAWRDANVPQGQPWAALVHAESERNTLADWVAGRLPEPSPTGDVKHFGAAHPNGVVVRPVERPYTVFWRMPDGTMVDAANNGSSNASIGLVPGKQGALVLSKATGSFAVGDELTLLFYHYRYDKDGMNLDGLITLDPAVLASAPPPSAAVTATKLVKANPNANNGTKPDGLRVKILAAVTSVTLPYTVSTTAHAVFDQDGPHDTYGYFPIGLYPPGTSPNVVRTGEIDHYTVGVWLR